VIENGDTYIPLWEWLQLFSARRYIWTTGTHGALIERQPCPCQVCAEQRCKKC